ncbi:hypothetical protein BHE74_00031501 [Ensete ventricosum]|nr:hypothetical protein BHE74_00031501 [Ensete ventricosum]
MRLGTRQEYVGSTPRVSRVCYDGAREFARRKSRLAGRLSGVAEKLIGMSSEGIAVAQAFGRLTCTQESGYFQRLTRQGPIDFSVVLAIPAFEPTVRWSEDIQHRAGGHCGETMHVASGRRIKYGGLTRRVHDGISVQLRQTGSWYGRTNDESTTRAGSGCKEHGHVKLTIGVSDLLAGIGPVVGPDVHRSEEKLAEDSHAWVIVERNDSRLREAKDPNLQNAVKHLVSGGRIRNPMHSLGAKI